MRNEELLDFDEHRELKTESSVRKVPLVGIALEVFLRFPDGFPRYRDKEDSFSQLTVTFLRLRGLFPTPDHKIYSLRHSFEDRLKEGGVGDEMRRLIMGHALGRPEYGEGGSLEYRQKLLKVSALTYDPRPLLLLDGRQSV